jgi:protein-tyrosine phosphatase
LDIRLHKREFALHILFVCTGNICRSPIAERLALAYCARSHLEGITASSAGTQALTGHPIEPFAARVLEDLGGDASDFAARNLTQRIAADADLVLTMTEAHRDSVLALAPRQLQRTFTLREAARLASEGNAQSVEDLAALRPRFPVHGESDVPDPIGRDETFFAAVGAQIAELLPPVLKVCHRDS